MRTLNAGDRAIIFEFGCAIDRRAFAQVCALDIHINALSEQGLLNGLVETIPTFRSLAVVFDPLITRHQEISNTLDAHPCQQDSDQKTKSRQWLLPVCYGTIYGPDIDDIARLSLLPTANVISLHQEQAYTVYMLGFLPGFAFMGDLPTPLHLPRKTEPRTRVPPGSVGIANQLTAVYPWESPGGWHLLGKCPVPFFNALNNQPSLLQANDTVRFQSVSDADLQLIEQDLANNRIHLTQFLQS